MDATIGEYTLGCNVTSPIGLGDFSAAEAEVSHVTRRRAQGSHFIPKSGVARGRGMAPAYRSHLVVRVAATHMSGPYKVVPL